MNTLLDRLAARTNINILLVLFLLFNLAVMPISQGQLKLLSGGASTLDSAFGYNAQTAYQMITAYGQQGREMYAIFEVTGDLIYAIIYALLLAAMIRYIFREAFAAGSRLQGLAFLPFGALLTDFAENACIVILLLLYPSRIDILATLAGILTTLRWLLIGASFLALVIGIIVYLAKTRQRA